MQDSKSSPPQIVKGYLTLDLSQSRKNLIKFCEDYNANLKAEDPEGYKGKTLKKTHSHTMQEILRLYSVHCLKNRDKKRPTNTLFYLCTRWLAKELSTNASTISRHVERLKLCGFIEEKFFRGTNCSPRYILNTSFLVPCKKSIPDGLNISFTSDSTGFISFRTHTNLSDTLNNIKYGEWTSPAAQSIEVLAKQNHETAETISETEPSKGQPYGFQAETGLPRRENFAVVDNFSPEVHACYRLLINILYKGKKYDTPTQNEVLFYLAKWCEPQKNKAAAIETFASRCIIKHNHLIRYPEYFMPSITSWMNPSNENGFRWTKSFHENNIKMRKSNKEFYNHIKIFSQSIRFYSSTPNTDSFRQIEIRLKKLKDQNYLEQFYKFVASGLYDLPDPRSILQTVQNLKLTPLNK